MIKIRNLTKTYGNQNIMNNTSFDFPNNGLVCLLGVSGCGKSTLLNMVAGFDSDYTGEISVFDTFINKMNADELCSYRRDNIGFIFQNYNLLTGYTVLENILLSSELNNSSTAQNKENAETILIRLDISDKKNEKVENLSGGQKQRAAIARALINNPSIILADEPTGALDRTNSTQIMELLKDISKDRLVLVITHDKKICEFADQIVSIKDGHIIGEQLQNQPPCEIKLKQKATVKVSAFKRGLKNFKVHITRYVAVSLAISIGVLAFMLSLSSGNIMKKSISDFKEKNTAFNNGYIKIEDSTEKILALLKDNNQIENVYQQFVLKNITLSIDGKSEAMQEKYPMPKATENMSYGVMPKIGQNQISLNPSVAKKFDSDINKLIGKELILKYGETEYKLSVSGIFNAGYDDFFVSSDIEKKFYETTPQEKPYSISYDVKNFSDVVSVSQTLENNGITSKTAAKEVGALQSTFEKLSSLFLVVSILILGIGLFISVILLVKLQNSRYREIGLLSALGFNKTTIRGMIVTENILLAAISAILNSLFIGATYLICVIFKLDLIITFAQISLSVLGTGIIAVLISIIASHKLLHTEPAVALRK